MLAVLLASHRRDGEMLSWTIISQVLFDETPESVPVLWLNLNHSGDHEERAVDEQGERLVGGRMAIGWHRK